MKKIVIIVSGICSIGLIAGAIWYSRQGTETYAPEQRTVPKSELAAANGKNGKQCYVAVNNVVYEIADSPNWQDGQHTTSQNQAYCGADMSAVIDKAPHGRQVLEQMIRLGPLGQ